MKIFHLKLDAYLSLQRNGYVSVSETGALADPARSWVRYYIQVNPERKRLEYSRYIEERDRYGDKKKTKKLSLCRVMPDDFILLSSYNR